MVLSDVASDLNLIGTALKADLTAWGAAIVGVALFGMAVLWVMKLVRS